MLFRSNTYYTRNSKENCSSDTAYSCRVTGNADWWTMSPFKSSSETAYVFWILNTGHIDYANLSSLNFIRPVISLKPNTLVSGRGTSYDPYIVEKNSNS